MAEIPLTKGYVAIVDDDDHADLSRFKWSAFVTGRAGSHVYAQRGEWLGSGRQRIVLMHRQILGEPASRIDHRNGNGLDNRRGNLRAATASQNAANQRKRGGLSSQYKGVCWATRDRRWKATIQVDSKTINLGFFINETDAAMAYDAAALEHFGEFALTNSELGR